MADCSKARGTAVASAARSMDERGQLVRPCSLPKVLASPIAKRPYDLRHAAVSTWLKASVEVTRVAEWAGHSVAVLLRVYAKFIDGGEQTARARVEEALRG